MKWWRSRAILGVVVGILNMLMYIGLIILFIMFLIEFNLEKKLDTEAKQSILAENILSAVLIVVCLTMSIISGLMVVGIIEKRHKYMLPWLILNGIFLAAICLLALLFLISIAGVSVCVILAAIFWDISSLYWDIRKQNIEGTVQVTGVL